MRLSCIVFLAASMAVATCHGVILDASNEGAGWTVAPGNDLDAFLRLTRDTGDPAIYAASLELLITGEGVLPTFESIDMKADGAVFAAGTQYPDVPYGLGTPNLTCSVDLNGATTMGEGLLANLVIDTTGVLPGVYTWTAVPEGITVGTGTHVINGVDFEDIPTTYISGAITVTPEPSSLVLGGIAALAFWAFRRIRRTSHALP